MSTAIFSSTEHARLLGKNQDVPYEGAFLFTNHRGIRKQAMVMTPARPAEWVSRLGSITVSQVCREMPNGGMNEAGLAVEQTTLWESDYPQNRDLPGIGELQWIQLLLDTCASVEEALQAATGVCIHQPMSRVHYILCDSSGDCAIVEFIGGEMKVYRRPQLPLLTNTIYEEAVVHFMEANSRTVEDRHCSRDCLSNYVEYQRNSMARFTAGAYFIEGRLPPSPPGEPKSPLPGELEIPLPGEPKLPLFDVLHAVRRADTVYRLVYDLRKKTIFFATTAEPERKMLDLTAIDFSRNAPPMMLNLQHSRRGNCRQALIPYELRLNRLAAHSFFRAPALSSLFGDAVTDEMIDYMVEFLDRYYTRPD